MSLYVKLMERAIGEQNRITRVPLSTKLRGRIIVTMDDATLDDNIKEACVWLEKHTEAPLALRQDCMAVLDELMVEQAKRQGGGR
jgi:hypothetical protein